MDSNLIAPDPAAGYEAVARAAVDCNIHYLQLRMKNATLDAVLETARLMQTENMAEVKDLLATQ